MKTPVLAACLVLVTVSAFATDLKPLSDMTTSKLPTAEMAERVVLKYVIADQKDGFSATHVVEAMIAFSLGFNVPDFGKKGDRVWQVHFIEFGQTVRIAWVNAETEKVKFMFPEK